MSNSIWKTPDQKPKKEELVAWEDRNGIHAGRFDICYNCFCACADYYVDLKNAIKWCSLENLENIIAQADKAERLQKAVDLAQEHLLSISDGYDIMKADAETIKLLFYAIQDEASETYKETKQLIKENQ